MAFRGVVRALDTALAWTVIILVFSGLFVWFLVTRPWRGDS